MRVAIAITIAIIALMLVLAVNDAYANTLTCHHARVVTQRHYHLRWFQTVVLWTTPCHHKGRHYVRLGRYRVRYDPDWYFPEQMTHYRR